MNDWMSVREFRNLPVEHQRICEAFLTSRGMWFTREEFALFMNTWRLDKDAAIAAIDKRAA